jgi:YD repeat-containing protein
VDSNGVATDYTYDLRQRLTSLTVGGQTISYEYHPTGLLKRVTQPDGSYVHHTYDDAHRLIAVSDNVGNRIDYTLDNAGNRTAESVKDTSGALRRQVSRSIDALGRVQQTTGRE